MRPSPKNPENLPRNPLARHPWIFVVLAFLLLISVWATFIILSTGFSTQKLSPAEEKEILERREVQP